jgi:dTDP-4-dehydrorhamnose reductase
VPNPVNAYGRSKLAGERAIAATGCDHLILRTSWIFSMRGTNFLTTILKLAREKPELPVVDDQIGSPTWARALAEATAGILKARQRAGGGIYHLTAAGQVSRCGFARSIIENARKLAPGGGAWPNVRPITSAQYPLPAARPGYCVLATARIERDFGVFLPPWEEQLLACQQAGSPV